jgi:hypothetical protein
MVRKNITLEVEKLKNLIEITDNGIPQKQKDKLLKQVHVINQLIKIPKIKSNAQSQFIRPYPVDDEMADFAQWDRGSEHSRIDITRAVCQYIKNNNLQIPENRKNISMDPSLKSLFGLESETITYPQIQKYIGSHFIKNKV